ncbi:MAG TPA: dihydropteroate synthase [Burkholderiales bacterium]|nr:dihydropteroate synthase [Burkholderiales bacterium]
MFFRCGKFSLSLSRPLIMGIVNVTPDSFSDGGKLVSTPAAINHAKQLVEEGADILDIGGESTRPGAEPVNLDEELQRVLPVLEGLKGVNVPVSVDTYKPEVMRAAISAGASMINDVNALLAPGAMESVAASDTAVCLMHKQGEPKTMQQNPQYEDVLTEVADFLKARVAAAEAAGVARERICIDPGIGFGKNLEHNLALLKNISRLKSIGVPVLIGVSRKSLLGKILGLEVYDRVQVSVVAAILAVSQGAAIVRVHDVKATKDALAVYRAVNSEQ